MIEVGETTGKLTLVLKLLAKQMKKDYELRRQVRGAMIYPAIILLVLAIVGTLMIIYVIPQLTATIVELGVELPWTTKIIIFVSNLLINYLIWIILGVLICTGTFWYAIKTPLGKRAFDTFVLKIPVFGPLINEYNTARFARTLSYLISSGVPIVRSLEITGRVLGNIHFQKAAFAASEEVQKGKQINQILGTFPVFQPMVIQMIEVGEETGKLSSMLLRLALFFEDEVSGTTKNLASIIEPVLMVIIGAVVAFFAISMLQPIYSSLGNI
jgi:type IV pilus assembly protein PilC